MIISVAKNSIIEMEPEEIYQHLKPTAIKAKQMAWDSNSWYSYKNNLCIEPDMFIHEFKDGRKELIQLGNRTSEFTILKKLD